MNKTSFINLQLWVDRLVAEEFEGRSDTVVLEDPETGGAFVQQQFEGESQTAIDWILSFGSSIEVLEPHDIRLGVVSRLEYALENHYAEFRCIIKKHSKVQDPPFVKREKQWEGALYENIEKNFSQRVDSTGCEIVFEERIKFWTNDLESLFGKGSPLGDGTIQHKIIHEVLEIEDGGGLFDGIVFEGNFISGLSNGLYWVLSRTSRLVVLEPYYFRKNVAEIISKTLDLYAPD